MTESSLSEAFGRILRERRQAKDLSQERLAERSGLHPTYISMVERGVRNPTLDVADRIALSLGEDLSTLIRDARALGKNQKKRNIRNASR